MRRLWPYAMLAGLALLASGRGAFAAATPDATRAEPTANSACSGVSLDALAPLAGTWIGRGAWPDGSKLHVRQHYFFGPTRQVLHFSSHDLSAGEPRLLYEGMIFIDPDDGCARQWNFTPQGKLTRSRLSDVGSRGFSVRGDNTHSAVMIEGERFRWQLDVEREGKRERVMDAVYVRESDRDARSAP